MSAARPGKIQHGIDRQREHRAFDEIAALATEHRSCFGMFAKQACIDQRRQILATLRGQLEASMNEIGQTAAPRAAVVRQVVSTSKKKSRAKAPLKNCVDPLSPKSDLSLLGGATLLLRVRVPPETWTTRLLPCGSSELSLVADLFLLVTFFGNECSKFRRFPKRMIFCGFPS